MERIRAGYCEMVNPYNARQVSRISLGTEDVTGIVFWTRNVGPFLKYLAELQERGIPFYFLYTVLGYPHELDRAVPPIDRTIEWIAQIQDTLGKDRIVWRYDPVLLSSLTPMHFHEDQCEHLASMLAPYCDEVIFSFANIYKKSRHNLDAAARQHDFNWSDPGEEEKTQCLSRLADIVQQRVFRPSICSQPDLLPLFVEPARCIDGERLLRLGATIKNIPVGGPRPGCYCLQSKDIGAYDTCPHGCAYCYAVQRPAVAQRYHKQHDPKAERL